MLGLPTVPSQTRACPVVTSVAASSRMSITDSSSARCWIWTIAACSAIATAYSLLSSWYCYDDHKAEDAREGMPDSFRDPITFDIIREPVVLCATSQVYDLAGLRQWFAAGHYRCPKTNLDVYDAQVVRLPWLKQSICNWLKSRGRPLPPEPYPSLPELKAMHPQIATCIRTIRAATGAKRAQAVALLAHLLRDWQDNTAAAGGAGGEVELQQQAAVRGAVMEDMLWLLRYAADDAAKASAAAVLFCCSRDDELGWLAAAGAVPLVAMLYSSNSTAQQWALQVLYKLCLRVPACRALLWHVGCVQALLHLISRDKACVAFHRDRAAVALATMAESPDVKEWLRGHGVVPLMALFLCSSDRWEQRDAAFALMALQLQQQDLQTASAAVLVREASRPRTSPPAVAGSSIAAGAAAAAIGAQDEAVHGVTGCSSSNAAAQTSSAAAAVAADTITGPGALLQLQQQLQGAAEVDWDELLSRFRWCSQQYLDGQVDEPDAGLTDEEKSARQQYETALMRYRQALQQRQQQQDMLHQPLWVAQGVAWDEGRRLLQQQQQQQQQHDDVHEQLHAQAQQPHQQRAAQQQQLHLQLQQETEQQQQQQQGQLQQEGVNRVQQQGQQQPQAPLQQHRNNQQVPSGGHLEQQQQPHPQQHRRRGQQQQPRHWMAAHDADGDSGAGNDAGLLRGLAGSSSSGSSDGMESDSDSSLASVGISVPVRLLGMR